MGWILVFIKLFFFYIQKENVELSVSGSHTHSISYYILNDSAKFNLKLFSVNENDKIHLIHLKSSKKCIYVFEILILLKRPNLLFNNISLRRKGHSKN